MASHTKFRLFIAVGALASSLGARGAEFPEGATAPSASEIKQLFSDKVFDVKLASGTTWRLEYKANGYFFLNTSNNFNASGDWKPEDGKMCGGIRGSNPSCNDIRVHRGVIHMKRDNGEVIQLVGR